MKRVCLFSVETLSVCIIYDHDMVCALSVVQKAKEKEITESTGVDKITCFYFFYYDLWFKDTNIHTMST